MLQRKYWDEHWKHISPFRKIGSKILNATHFPFMPNTEGLVLEVGCGYSRTKKYKNWIGVDFEEIVQPTVVADAHYLPFKDKTFKLVYSFGLIEHLLDPFKAITEMKRISRRVYFGIPRANGLSHKTHNLFNNIGLKWFYPPEKYYSEKDFPLCKKIKTILGIIDFYQY